MVFRFTGNICLIVRRYTSNRLSGTWTVGGGNYAGDGIYFGIFRKTLRNYQSGSAIVARVTMGKTIDTVLMPNAVYNQAGHPNASAVSNWGLNNGYTAGEWWRTSGSWWEICLFDRKNKSFVDTIELTRTWESVDDCASNCIDLQNKILTEPLGTLTYGSTTRGNAIASNCSMNVFGCACIFTITLEGTST